MICPSCRRAGEFNALANMIDGEIRGTQRELAAEAHEECPGGTRCDCQHFVGRALNQERLRGTG